MAATLDSSDSTIRIMLMIKIMRQIHHHKLCHLMIFTYQIIFPKKIEEPVPEAASESEETDITTGNVIDGIPETDTTQSPVNSTNMITAEASFTEATSADLPLGTPRSSIARILVKPGQIFRVQVDNEVKEVHGKFMFLITTEN